MTSDEREAGAFEALISRLRETVGQQVQSALDDLAAAALADRDRATVEARSDADRAAAERLAADLASAELRAKDAAHSEGYALGKEHGYSAGKDEGFAAGKDHGYAAGKDEGYAAGAEDARSQAPPVVDRTAAAAATSRLSDGVRAIGQAKSLSEILDALLAAAGREAARAALFLVRGRQFRAWRLAGFDVAHDEKAPLEFSFEEAGVLADAAATRQMARSADAGVAPSFASLPSDRECVAVPIMLGGEVVAVLYADQNASVATTVDDAGTGHPVMDTAVIDVLTRHAGRSLEAMTAFKAARALLASPDGSGSPVDSHATTEAAKPGAHADADASAQRYARLLVSEIKLYHEAAVMAGRRAGDLGQRLGDEIARARVLYEQRVPPPVRARTDYFHDELVRTLANGDPALLEVRG